MSITLDKCGIYAIRNLIDGKLYIGQSIKVTSRKWQHYTLLRKSAHHCIHLQRAWNKFGEDAFEHILLEECESADLTAREQHWMDATAQDRLYNHAPSAGSPKGIKRSAATIAKWKAARIGYKTSSETKEKMRLAQSRPDIVDAKRKKIQEQRNDPMFVAACSRKGAKATDATREKLSAVAKARWAKAGYRERLSAKQKEAQKLTAPAAALRMKDKWADPEFRAYMLQCRSKKNARNSPAKEY